MRWLARQWWTVVRFGFRLLYNELAFTYDLVSWVVSLGTWRCWQRAALKHLNQADAKHILEIAHGTGNIQIDLKALGYCSVGLDLSSQMGKIARQKLVRQGYDSLLVQGRGQCLPFRSGSYDGVVVTFPTPFVFEDETLREVERVLAEKGVLVIVLNGQFLGSNWIQRFFEWLYRITGQRTENGDGILDEIRAVFTRNSFDVQTFNEPCPRSFAQVFVARKRL